GDGLRLYAGPARPQEIQLRPAHLAGPGTDRGIVRLDDIGGDYLEEVQPRRQDRGILRRVHGAAGADDAGAGGDVRGAAAAGAGDGAVRRRRADDGDGARQGDRRPGDVRLPVGVRA